jgi:hypothetical protein
VAAVKLVEGNPSNRDEIIAELILAVGMVVPPIVYQVVVAPAIREILSKPFLRTIVERPFSNKSMPVVRTVIVEFRAVP